MERHKLDGNAAAGVLREIFPFEMTIAEAACVGCDATYQVGALVAYIHQMGTIVRCPTCDNALIRIAQGRGRYWLDLRGVKYLQIEET